MIGDVWILHAIDYMTRFSCAAVLKNKSTEEVVGKFFTIWIAVFGPPEKLLCDNGGEFISYTFESMCESFDIKQLTTAAESPFSNGVCERHNGLIGEMTEKVYQDVKCPLPIALMWATHAKNALINISGFSPYQLTVCPGWKKIMIWSKINVRTSCSPITKVVENYQGFLLKESFHKSVARFKSYSNSHPAVFHVFN